MKLKYEIKNNSLTFVIEHKGKRYVGIGTNDDMWQLVERISKQSNT